MPTPYTPRPGLPEVWALTTRNRMTAIVVAYSPAVAAVSVAGRTEAEAPTGRRRIAIAVVGQIG